MGTTEKEKRIFVGLKAQKQSHKQSGLWGDGCDHRFSLVTHKTERDSQGAPFSSTKVTRCTFFTNNSHKVHLFSLVTHKVHLFHQQDSQGAPFFTTRVTKCTKVVHHRVHLFQQPLKIMVRLFQPFFSQNIICFLVPTGISWMSQGQKQYNTRQG